MIVMILACVAGANTYTTTFPATENPISEGGKWVNGKVGLDWSNCATSGGKSIGQMNGGTGDSYYDATALMTGTWSSNQTVEVILYRGSPTESNYPEVEARLRSTIAAHSITGYEVMWSLRAKPDCYIAIARWNGAFANFTILGYVGGSQYIATNGSTLKASIVGSTISVWLNGTFITNVTDTTFKTGNPGIGFDHKGPSSDDVTFGITRFSASDSVPTKPAAPTNLRIVASR